MTTATLAHKQRDILLLNADYQPLGKISLQKAVSLLHKEKAEVCEMDDSKEFLRDWLWPKVVRLVKQAKLAYDRLYGPAIFSNRGVLIRDDYLCAYCGKHATTIDHVVPKSRGGANDWMNTVAACFTCNNKKDNKFLSETNLTLRYTPWMPNRADLRKYK